MNQIIYLNDNQYKKTHNKNHFYLFILIFIISVLSLILLLYYFINYYRISQINNEFSESLSDVVRIQSLYKDAISYNNSFPIIGQIEIKKININYPIFSESNDDLLKLGICRLYGPQPNNVGNMCLVGHNYNNEKFFSKLNNLEINDIITIYDIDNIFVNYEVTNIFEIESNNTSVLSQNINYREITLITCNNFNKKRLVIKAKEIE